MCTMMIADLPSNLIGLIKPLPNIFFEKMAGFLKYAFAALSQLEETQAQVSTP